jgi:D-alanyl-D-alanine carboxypeptidase
MVVGTLALRQSLRQLIFLSCTVACALTAFLLSTGSALATKTSSIVIDAETGKVLSQHDPDRHNYPASLTKMMTLYLTFDALEKGKLHLDDRFTTSAHASAQAPSKLGLTPGEDISVHDLILAIVTHSANDAAVVLAEGQADGSEAAFVKRMNAQAQALGMTKTTYRNANGLPNREQVTTARDTVKLARALYLRFPHEYKYFATEHFTFHGIDYTNHNHLMKSFRGMDGIKTGYIHASGFNLAASAVRDGRRLIGVVLGGQSAHLRDHKMAALLNRAFSNPAPATMVADADNDDSDDRSLAERTVAALSPVGRAEAAPMESPPEHPHHVAVRHAKYTGKEHWSIQVGAFTHHAAAARAGATALAKLPRAKGKTAVVLSPSRGDKERLYRARILRFSEKEAEKACRTLHRKHRDCAVVQMADAH